MDYIRMTTFWCCEKGDLNWFLKNAIPGQMFIYYKGYMYDSLLGKALGSEIYKLAIKGLVYLVQKRSSDYRGFNYYLIKASKPPIISLVPLTDEKLAELGKV